jgi:hypothetical protein
MPAASVRAVKLNQCGRCGWFGVQKPELKAIACVPQLPQLKLPAIVAAARDTMPATWLGVSVCNIADEGEMSAFGLPGVMGVLVLEVPAESALGKSGLRRMMLSFLSTATRRRIR